MLACTRIGAPHTVVFGGFSADALRDRINDCQAKVCITADGGWRRGKVINLKGNVDEALAQTPSITACVVLKRVGNEIAMKQGRDHYWSDLVAAVPAETQVAPESLPAEHPLFILYTSGTDGQAEGHRAHDRRLPAGHAPHHQVRLRSAGQRHPLVHRPTSAGSPGHSYVVYGPLSNGATTVMYEGAPDFPTRIASGRSSSGAR
jgi:acetyl-CoA synthetase